MTTLTPQAAHSWSTSTSSKAQPSRVSQRIVSIRLLASSQRTYVGLGGFGIEIAETETLES